MSSFPKNSSLFEKMNFEELYGKFPKELYKF